MAFTRLQISNIAVGMVGGTLLLNEDTDRTVEARLLREGWDLFVEDTLAGRDWSHAREIAALVSTTDPLGLDRFAYEIPEDALTVRRLGVDHKCDNDVFWEIQSEVIIAEHQVTYIRYTKKMTDIALFDAPFVSALVARLAMELALPVTNSRPHWEAMLTLYAARLVESSTTNAMQGKREPFPQGKLNKARNR